MAKLNFGTIYDLGTGDKQVPVHRNNKNGFIESMDRADDIGGIDPILFEAQDEYDYANLT